jgi:hypothetical protein
MKKTEKQTHTENTALQVIEAAQPSIKEAMQDNNRALLIDEIGRAISLRKDETDSYTRNEEIISPAITRPIDLYEKNDQGQYIPKRDEYGHAIELSGALGVIPGDQMPFIQISNFNSIYTMLTDGIYEYIYEMDKKTGAPVLDDSGQPKLLYKKFVNIGDINRERQLNANLALDGARVKLEGQILVGNAGGSPLGVGGSWDDTLKLLFGSGKK